MPTNINSRTMNSFDSHTQGLVEFYGWVNADGTIKTGCSGVDVTRNTTGSYDLQLRWECDIRASDFTYDVNLYNKVTAWGTGYTKTCQFFATAIADSVLPTADICQIAIMTADFVDDIFPTFRVTTARRTPGSAIRQDDCQFTFKIVVSSSKGGRY